ncbi:MAG TPA: hypothetical protein VF932_00135 [Anaerolineae bacterium]
MQNLIELLQRRIWLGPLIGLIIGIVLGLLFGWVVVPVSWAPASDDIASMADAYEINPAAATTLAKARLAGLSKEEQARLFTDTIRDRTASGKTLEARRVATLAQVLNVPIGPAAAITPAATGPATSRTPTTGTSPASTSAMAGLLPIVLLFVVIALIVAAALVFLARVLPQLRAAQAARQTQAASASPSGATVSTAMPARPVTPAVATTTPGGLGRHVATYTLGNDNYDTSFSLETARQEFLGECGMGISETIGEGKPDKVTAFDLWLFDKADVRTVTQIVMSEYAFNDQGMRAKLAAKGEAILAEKDKTIQLETQSLRLAAQIKELVYANNPGFPPNSHFQKLTLEIVPSLKEATAS